MRTPTRALLVTVATVTVVTLPTVSLAQPAPSHSPALTTPTHIALRTESTAWFHTGAPLTGIRADAYDSFAELAQDETEGEDYRIRVKKPAGARLAHIAIHGGMIESGTTQLAEECAGNRHRFYTFEGIKDKDNSTLHITSSKFDEPQGINLAENSDYTISWHGAKGETPKTYIGGLDAKLRKRIEDALKRANFAIGTDTPSEIDGDSLKNITNKNRNNAGVQLELTRAQRDAFFKDADGDGKLERSEIEDPANRTTTFYRYTAAIKQALTSVGP